MPTVDTIRRSGQKGRISRKSAKGYVRRGRAVWVDDDTILLIVTSPSARTTPTEASAPRELEAGALYCAGRDRIATRRQIRGLPLLRPDELLAPVSGRQQWAWRTGIQIKLSQYPASE